MSTKVGESVNIKGWDDREYRATKTEEGWKVSARLFYGQSFYEVCDGKVFATLAEARAAIN